MLLGPLAFHWLTLDDFSRNVIAWRLCATMRAKDVTGTLEPALEASGCDQPTVPHRPRPLSDNGSSYIAGDLAVWLEDQRMERVRGAPKHPQKQGEIERWHQTLKNRILLEKQCLPGALEAAIGEFVDHCNHRRIHESLGNVTPADACLGRAHAILEERRRIKEQTIRRRRSLNQGAAA